MSRVSTPHRPGRLGQGMVYVDRQATRLTRKRWTSRKILRRGCQPDGGDQAKNRAVARNVQLLQGPGTAGMIVWRSQARLAIGHARRRRRAAGLNARPPCVDGVRWRVNGLSCAWRKSDSRTLGQRRDYLRATRRLPAWVTAGKGPIAPGRSRAQNQQVQVPDDRDHRPRRQDVTARGKMPEATQ